MNRRSVFNFSSTIWRQRKSLAIGLVCSLLLLSGIRATAQQEDQLSRAHTSLAAKVAESIKTISKSRSASVVRIRCHDDYGKIVGTGFAIDPTGTIITLAEIVRDAEDITVERSENGGQTKSLPASVIAIDQRSGVAFLKINSPKGSVSLDSASFITPLSITNASAFTPVISIGYPAEQKATPVLGMITGSKNHDGDIFFCVTHLTASLPLSEGEGGSPVLDLSGNLLGIIITGNTQLGSCTILPAAAIEQLHHNLLRYGGINPGWVGAVVEIAAVPQKNSQTRIVSVAPGSPAENAGIKAGDTLLALGKHDIQMPDDVLDASFYLSAGEPLDVTIVRKGTIKHLTLHCGERPSPDGNLQATLPALPSNLLGESAH